MYTMSAYMTDNGKLSTDCEATVVSTTLGHRVYTRHRHTIESTPSLTHRDLAHDRPVDRTKCLFTDSDTGYGPDTDGC